MSFTTHRDNLFKLCVTGYAEVVRVLWLFCNCKYILLVDKTGSGFFYHTVSLSYAQSSYISMSVNRLLTWLCFPLSIICVLEDLYLLKSYWNSCVHTAEGYAATLENIFLKIFQDLLVQINLQDSWKCQNVLASFKFDLVDQTSAELGHELSKRIIINKPERLLCCGPLRANHYTSITDQKINTF